MSTTSCQGRGRQIAVAVALLLSPPSSGAFAQASAPTQPIVERIETGLSITPDFKFTELDDKPARLAGLYGGVVNDGRLLLGAGAYWLTNREADFKMAYGGVVVEWFTKLDGPVNFSARGLVGGGGATLSDQVVRTAVPVFDRRLGRPTLGLSRVGRVRLRDTFLVAEPQATVLFRLNDWFRFSLGAGYRVTGATDVLEDRLNGFTGTVGLQFGL